jgi:hypothetical protein
MRYLILSHQGLGDHIIMNGYIHHLRKTQNPEEIRIIALNDYRKDTLEHLYSDFPCITFYWLHANTSWMQDSLVNQVNGIPRDSSVKLNGHSYICKNFGAHSDESSSWLKPKTSWADCFYLQHNLPPTIRFSEFILPSNMTRAKEKYDALCKELATTNFVLIHDDPHRGRFIRSDIVKKCLIEDGMEPYPVVYLGKKRYEKPLFDELTNTNQNVAHLLETLSILDFTYILQHAKACHFMDSSIACLTDVLHPQGKLYIHAYITPFAFTEYGRPHQQNAWIYLKEDGQHI